MNLEADRPASIVAMLRLMRAGTRCTDHSRMLLCGGSAQHSSWPCCPPAPSRRTQAPVPARAAGPPRRIQRGPAPMVGTRAAAAPAWNGRTAAAGGCAWSAPRITRRRARPAPARRPNVALRRWSRPGGVPERRDRAGSASASAIARAVADGSTGRAARPPSCQAAAHRTFLRRARGRPRRRRRGAARTFPALSRTCGPGRSSRSVSRAAGLWPRR